MIGIPASPGIAIGRAHLLATSGDQIVEYNKGTTDDELLGLKSAVQKAKEEIEDIKNMTEENMGSHEAQIFESHLMILSDPELLGHIEEGIKDDMSAPDAVIQSTDFFAEMFAAMDNPYMQERAADIRDVLGRVKNALLGIETSGLKDISEPVILVTHDLTPSDTAQLPKNLILGFVTEVGGATSHSAIMARTLEIPAVVGASYALGGIEHGDLVILDGDTGEILKNPDDKLLSTYEEKRKKEAVEKEKLNALIGQASVSKCGKQVEVACNIGSPDDVAVVNKNDGEGVGLFRSEFLYMDRSELPSEDEQFSAYKEAVSGLGGKPVIIRTLDVGGDKNIPYLDLPKEMNPFLGYRAIRYCLDESEVFLTQLRAILRASAFGKAKIMFPMISTMDELKKAKAFVYEAMKSLDEKGVSYDKNIEIGMMIEIPAAALISDILAEEVDFFSIGTNDLVQYTTAVDRMNQQISSLYTPYHPAVLRLIKMVIENGHKAGIWVGMCGEAAGIKDLVPLWLAMGLDEFSVSPSSVLRVRGQIRDLDREALGDLVKKTLSQPSAHEVKDLLNSVV
ncbi:phosphoenolpyruvate--protein phosphotransferase [Fusibacter sp. JL216-2]|uniref:phosphoenolpyruvate--protein phosphotransferase n=1 Tax=Fusibacter sp. JL216-2 TaxID=3071453 RepID=UPI003D357CB6